MSTPAQHGTTTQTGSRKINLEQHLRTAPLEKCLYAKTCVYNHTSIYQQNHTWHIPNFIQLFHTTPGGNGTYSTLQLSQVSPWRSQLSRSPPALGNTSLSLSVLSSSLSPCRVITPELLYALISGQKRMVGPERLTFESGFSWQIIIFPDACACLEPISINTFDIIWHHVPSGNLTYLSRIAMYSGFVHWQLGEFLWLCKSLP